MTRYLFLLAHEPGGWERLSAQEQQEAFAAHARFDAYVGDHGRLVSSAPLAGTDTATTIRHRDGQRVATDGPFAETSEVIGGYYDVELPDLGAAITAASILPHGYAVEIRPTIVIDRP